MKLLYDQLIDDVQNENYDFPVFKHYLNDSIQGNCYRNSQKRFIKAEPDEIVVDFIANMTDDYFIDVCKELHLNDGIIKELSYYEYF